MAPGVCDETYIGMKEFLVNVKKEVQSSLGRWDVAYDVKEEIIKHHGFFFALKINKKTTERFLSSLIKWKKKEMMKTEGKKIELNTESKKDIDLFAILSN